MTPIDGAQVLGVNGGAVLPWFVLLAGCFGLIVGSFLSVVVWRVPRGESLLLGSRCPKCDRPLLARQNVPLVSWVLLGARCAGCRQRISVRYPLLELATGLAFGGVAWWTVSVFGWPLGHPIAAIGWWAQLAAYCWFAAASIALVVIDIAHQRLPDLVVLPTLSAVAVLLGGASLLGEGGPDWYRLVGVFGGGALLFALYTLLVLISPSGMGGGDLKLAPVTGAALGFVGWGALAVGSVAAFAVGALVGVALIAAGRVNRTSGVAFGPFMLLGAWVGILWGEPIIRAALEMFGIAE